MHLLVHRHRAKRKSAGRRDSKFWVNLLDKLTLVIGVIGPMTDIPQILKLIETRNASGVSLLAWSGAAFFDVPFLLYGIVHKDRAITTTYSLWLIGNVCIMILVIMFS